MGSSQRGQKCFSWFTNDELVFAMYVNQLVTLQPLNRPDELEQLHILKTMLSILLNNGKTGRDAMNSIWYMKQPNLRQATEHGIVDATQKPASRHCSDRWP